MRITDECVIPLMGDDLKCFKKKKEKYYNELLSIIVRKDFSNFANIERIASNFYDSISFLYSRYERHLTYSEQKFQFYKHVIEKIHVQFLEKQLTKIETLNIETKGNIINYIDREDNNFGNAIFELLNIFLHFPHYEVLQCYKKYYNIIKTINLDYFDIYYYPESEIIQILEYYKNNNIKLISTGHGIINVAMVHDYINILQWLKDNNIEYQIDSFSCYKNNSLLWLINSDIKINYDYMFFHYNITEGNNEIIELLYDKQIETKTIENFFLKITDFEISNMSGGMKRGLIKTYVCLKKKNINIEFPLWEKYSSYYKE